MKRIIAVFLAVLLCLSLFGCASGTPQEPETVENETPQEVKKLVALSFDDGPNNYTTPKVLDVLEKYGVKATFFYIGEYINDDTAAVMQRAVDLGCEIGNHSKNHLDMSQMTVEEIHEQIDYVDVKVYEYLGIIPELFRPPYLAVSETMHQEIDHTFIFGVSSGDSSDISVQERIDNVLSRVDDGAIVLMHDFYGNDRTAEALETIIPELIEQGYELVTVSELFEAKCIDPKKNSGIIYSFGSENGK